ncbi:MAG TPA: MerR family DNA-binding transcriptional regulator [Burkholderiaceae bacterium]|nr:MerR family DNA-binding transcriptional regulator [Burkholderiaceae bacterium]
MKISELSSATDIPVETIRFYERGGLPPDRNAARQFRLRAHADPKLRELTRSRCNYARNDAFDRFELRL